MKAFIFVAGVSVGAVATVGVALGSALIAANKITNGDVADIIKVGCADLKKVVLGKDLREK